MHVFVREYIGDDDAWTTRARLGGCVDVWEAVS